MKDDVLEFWFGDTDERGVASDATVKRWFVKSDEFDNEIEARFGDLRREILAGRHEDWLNEPLGQVAYVVALDQFSRNLGRDTPVMYEADDVALRATKSAIGQQLHVELGVDFAIALLMPLMHSESLEDQDLCVELFHEMTERYPDIDRLRLSLDYAIKHRDIVARFGRFPHRNPILGRTSTPEEVEFLKQPGSSF